MSAHRQVGYTALYAVSSWRSSFFSCSQCSRRPRGVRRGIRCTAASDTPDVGISSVYNANRFRDSLIDRAEASTDGSLTEVIPIEFVRKDEWEEWFAKQDQATQLWLKAIRNEKWAPTAISTLPKFNGDSPGSVSKVVAPVSKNSSPIWAVAALVSAVPAGRTYQVIRNAGLSTTDIEIGWAVGNYSYTAYKTKGDSGSSKSFSKNENEVSRLILTTSPEDRGLVEATASATYMVRDIINAPAEDFGPASLEAACSALSSDCGARCIVIVGEQLLRHGYPQVHTVGRAAPSDRAPRLIEILWNEEAKQTLTLVGKGVCYDTGGLSVKPTSAMLTMKKDLGGAALVLGLARMIINRQLNVRLRVLIPAVENSVGAASYRPGDILTARNGTTTVNMNSDAEGRLILADALVAAAEEDPALIIDCATLTGAQRVALGPDIPAIFCNNNDIANRICDISEEVNDLVWRLPLHAPYRKLLESSIADIKSCGSGPYAGAITAALYLQEFVDEKPWVHMDFMGFNTASSPGRPEGGEAMGMRALFHYLQERFGSG